MIQKESISNWKVKIATLFPEIFPGPLSCSLAGRALKQGIWSLDIKDIRQYGKKNRVDDRPFGGGGGMVMCPDVIDATLSDLSKNTPDLPIIYLSPKGQLLTQKRCREIAAGPGMILLCGRYEGIDQRVLDAYCLEEISIGDYILMGGDLPAMILIESCIRLVKGVINNSTLLDEESFEMELLEYPHYTRPENWKSRKVPEILLSGNHKKIKDWRQYKAEEITQKRRPDIYSKYLQSRS